jgi:methylenetetrahydrofolate dehydrogenase (NADP+)/methenyltetrahydrofolate cyclohydrolase
MKEADLIITAIGKQNSITADMVKDNAVIIDIGISKDSTGKICGDVDALSMKDKSGFLSPVPGGVGPMTIAMAFLNTLLAFKKQKNIQ